MQEIDRTRRVAALIQRELSQIIPRELNDNRINSVSLTGVTVTRDLKQAVVYVSSVEDGASQLQIEALLNNAARFLRHILSQQVELRITPSLKFKYDESIERGVNMSSLINQLLPTENSDDEST